MSKNMCEELKKEIEESKNLGRRARRIKERELQKNIRIRILELNLAKPLKNLKVLIKSKEENYFKIKIFQMNLEKLSKNIFPI